MSTSTSAENVGRTAIHIVHTESRTGCNSQTYPDTSPLERFGQTVALGIIEPVPTGTPTTWCSRMVTVPKKDGTPQSMVDLQTELKCKTGNTSHIKHF